MKTLLFLLTMLLLCGFIRDDALHPPPDCGPYDYEDFTPAAANFPAVGATYTDPIFNETVIRLTNIYPTNAGSGIMQPINGYWSANSTYYIHDDPNAGLAIINASTGAVVRSNVPTPASGDGGMSFDPLDDDSYYYTLVGDTRLLRYSVSGNSSTTVKTFGSALAGLGFASDWIDKTGDIFLLNIGGSFRIWKKSTDTLYTGSVTVPTGGGDLGVPPGWIGLSPDGNYVVLSQQSKRTSYAINHGTTTLSTSGVMFWDAISSLAGDHGDLVSTSDGGNYMMTFQNVHTFQGSSRHYFRVNITNAVTAGSSTQLTATGNQMLIPILAGSTAGNGHMSCAAKGTYQDWCYAAIEDPADLIGNPGTWYQYKSEIIMVHMLPPFEVRRLLHHRARPWHWFCRSARPVANWDGTKMMFTSPFSAPDDAAQCGYSDLYRWDAHE